MLLCLRVIFKPKVCYVRHSTESFNQTKAECMLSITIDKRRKRKLSAICNICIYLDSQRSLKMLRVCWV